MLVIGVTLSFIPNAVQEGIPMALENGDRYICELPFTSVCNVVLVEIFLQG